MSDFDATDVVALSIEEAKRRLQIGHTKIFGEIQSGRLKARKLGRRTVILSSDLAAYIAALPAVKISARAA